MRPRVLILLAAVLLPWLSLLQPSPGISHDVAWFYYVARGVLHGGTLYRDYIEPNAPLASLTLLPVVWLHAAFDMAPALGLRFYFICVCSLMLLLCLPLLAALRLRPWEQLWSLASLTLVCMFLPKENFGQREQLLTMLLIPYVLAAAVACQAVALRPMPAAAAGIAAAMAVFVKPPFVLVPVLLEAAVLLRTRRLPWRRAETWAFGAVMAGLIAATAVWFPLYAKTVVPWAVALYGGYNLPLRVLAETVAILVALAVGGWFACRPGANAPVRALRDCVMIGFIGALLAFAVQGKGWFYQCFPASAFAGLLVAGAVGTAASLRPLAMPADAARCVMAGFGVIVAASWLAYGPSVMLERTLAPDVVAEIARTPGPFVVFSSSVDPGFPLALNEDRVWASRYPCLIMLPGILKAERNGGISPWEAPFRATLVADMVRYRPSLVVVSEEPGQALPPDFSVLDWLRKDPDFAAQLAVYRDEGSRGKYRVFARQ
jgi:hypothetical protein